MKKFLVLALALLIPATCFAFRITLTGASDNTLGNFYFPCTPKDGSAMLYIPALGGAKTLTVRGFNSDNTSAYTGVYTNSGATLTAITYTTPNNIAFYLPVTWGQAGILGTTDHIGYNILVSDNSALAKTGYIFGECR